MRAAVVLGVLSVAVGVARAEPPDPDAAFAECKTRRRALTREAMRIDDLSARGRALAQLPICSRLPDGSTEVIHPPAIPIEPARPSPNLDASVAAGLAIWIGHERALPDLGATAAPVVELAAGYWWSPRLGVGAAAGISVLAFGYTVRDQYGNLLGVDGREQLVEGALELRVRADPARFAVGIGAQQMHTSIKPTQEAPQDFIYTRPLVEASASYSVARVAGVSFDFVAAGTIALDASLISSARVALAVRR